jgi:hypothetical protein
MRLLYRVLTGTAIVLCSACGAGSSVGAMRSPTGPTATAVDAVLVVSAFDVSFNAGHLQANFTLSEAGGLSGATLESIVFAESGGGIDTVAAWCWGDAPPRIAPSSSFDAHALGYCQPTVLTRSPGDSATLAVAYRHDDGRRATVYAATRLSR